MPLRKYATEEEKRAAKREQDRERNQKRVFLKGAFEKWMQLKQDKGLNSDEEVANLLLTRYVVPIFTIYIV